MNRITNIPKHSYTSIIKIGLIVLVFGSLSIGWQKDSGSSGYSYVRYEHTPVPGQTFAIKTDGTLWAWGWNDYGQLGLGDTISRTSPTQVGTDTNWSAIAAGYYHTIALKNDGTLWAWGDNSCGQLGDGTYTDKNVPTQITGTNWSVIATGGDHSSALKTDGTLWVWGRNYSGQLGDGTYIDKNVPTQITGTNWSVIAAGGSYTVTLKADGSLWTWGWNAFGQLGDGTYTDKNVPTQITGTNWSVIAVGASHTVALKTDGSLWAWGDDYNGQLGDGTGGYGVSRSLPAQIAGTGWTSITAGCEFSIALNTDGTLWGWGSDSSGQLGDGTTGFWWGGGDGDYITTGGGCFGRRRRECVSSADGYSNNPKYVPTKIGTDTDWSIISAGPDYVVALKTDGTLWAWGDNYYGQLGDGTNTDRLIPIKIGTDTNWAKVYASH